MILKFSSEYGSDFDGEGGKKVGGKKGVGSFKKKTFRILKYFSIAHAPTRVFEKSPGLGGSGIKR